MKNILFAAILFFSFAKVQSQTCGGPALLNENFNSSIPVSWTIIDVDGNTMSPFLAGQGYTGQWQSFNHPGKKCAAVANGSSSNDYLITPAITLGAGQSCLSWKGSASSPFSQQSYEIRISTTTPNVAGMLANSALLVVTAENAWWTEHQINLSAFAGQTVYIGFHSTGPGWVTFLDDVTISSPVNLDASISSVTIPEILMPGSYSISGRLLNNGLNSISSLTLNWNVNNGPVNSTTLSSLNIATGSFYNYSSSISFNQSANGTYLIKVWASALNSSVDQFPLNDTLSKYVFINTFPKKLLVEEFTQAGCVPCAAVNPYFDDLLFPNLDALKITAIKYHSSWPGIDQMYDDNPSMSDARVFYYDVPAVPEALVDGTYIPDYNSTWLGDPSGLTQTRIDSACAVPSIYEISIVNSTVSSTTNVAVTVTAKSDIPMTEMHLYTVIIEDSVNYSGSNGEEVFYQVARQMLPTSSGQLLPAMNANQSVTYNFSYPVTSVYDPTLLRTVAFITDDATRKVYQTEVASPYANPAGVNEAAIKYELNVFPNPAQNNITVSANGINANTISWSLTNMIGEIVLQGNDSVTNNQFRKQLDISTLPAGIYFFNINNGNETAVKKIIVQ